MTDAVAGATTACKNSLWVETREIEYSMQL